MMNETMIGKGTGVLEPVNEQIARIIEQAQEQGLQLTGEGVCCRT